MQAGTTIHQAIAAGQQSPSRLDAFAYNKKIGNILDRHYVLAFPQLHRLNRTLKEQLVADLDYTETLQTIRHQVVIDYELLKKALGYPSESFRDLFIRMTPEIALLVAMDRRALDFYPPPSKHSFCVCK